MYVPWSAVQVRRELGLGQLFSPSTGWVQMIEHSLSGSVASAFTHWYPWNSLYYSRAQSRAISHPRKEESFLWVEIELCNEEKEALREWLGGQNFYISL